MHLYKTAYRKKYIEKFMKMYQSASLDTQKQPVIFVNLNKI